VIRFVTGTDTGVGKTVAAAALCRMDRAAGRTVLYAKPVQTGLERAQAGDAAFVAAAAKVPVVECLRFPEPLAPAVAAERAGAVIDVGALLTDLEKAGDGFDRVVVEGAGGLLVPLWEELTMADLAAGLDADLVLLRDDGASDVLLTVVEGRIVHRR
jgi:dethiobiotin synthetase